MLTSCSCSGDIEYNVLRMFLQGLAGPARGVGGPAPGMMLPRPQVQAPPVMRPPGQVAPGQPGQPGVPHAAMLHCLYIAFHANACFLGISARSCWSRCLSLAAALSIKTRLYVNFTGVTDCVYCKSLHELVYCACTIHDNLSSP